MRRRRNIALFFLLMFITTSIPFGHFVKAGTIPSIADNDPIVGGTDANKFYFVAMYVTSINKNPDGSWTPGQRWGSHPDIKAPYEFTLSERRIVDLKAQPFTQSMIDKDAKWLKVYEKSRSDYAWLAIDKAVNNTYTPNPVNIVGKGTDTVSFDVNMTGIVLDAPSPQATYRGDEPIGYTFYFPMLITLTTEPQLIVKHFTTTGQSLDGVFSDRKQVMANGQSYTVTPPGNAQYTYVGYKQANETPPSGGSPQSGNYQFTYDKTYNRKYVFLYYQEGGGQINVRQMVRTSPGGAYSQQASALTPVNTLPDTRTISAAPSYGTVIGKSLSYTAFSDTASAGSSVSVNLTSTQKTAYVTFFYLIIPLTQKQLPTRTFV